MTSPANTTVSHDRASAPASVRTIYLNDTNRNASASSEDHYANNKVSTSKYTMLTFLPKTLFEFFRIVANGYFLLISILQVSTDLSPTNQYTTVTPLAIIFLITIIKQGLEDSKRHRADKEMNNRPAKVVRNGSIATVPWRDVVVGDILLTEDRHEVPADIVVLATSEEEAKCFTETANLDGETNLKRREAVKAVAEHLGYVHGPPPPAEAFVPRLTTLKGHLLSEQPNNHLYTYEGSLTLNGGGGGGGGAAAGAGSSSSDVIPVGPENVILRGCMLRSCKYVFGLVVFTGNDTKIMMNQRPTPSKQSNVYKIVNRCISLIFLTQFILCMSSSIMFGVWSKDHEGGRVWYLGNVLETVSTSDLLTSFITFLILYNNLVPISLYVSLDMIKVWQARLIEKDTAMRYTTPDGEEKYAKARTSELNEDLGQIEYIFSDKTGTLTRNMMEFRKCSIGGVAYGFGTTEIGEAAQKRGASAGPLAPGILPVEEQQRLANRAQAQVLYDSTMNFDDPRLLQDLTSRAPNAQMIDEFLTLLAVCHTVIPETDSETGVVAYRAASPDEEALVKFAKCMGYDFKTPIPTVRVEVSAGSKHFREYQVLHVNEFNSTRKRMSVVVRHSNGSVVLYCKGADNVILERAVADPNQADLVEHLRSFASEGLRTLVCATRVLSEPEYQAWAVTYEAAATAMGGRAEKLAAAAEAIERDMTIVGATAIEDKLQEGVPDAIASLSEAAMKIWVLTGDKEETAINIGFACRLLTNSMSLIKVNQTTKRGLRKQLQDLLESSYVFDYARTQTTCEDLALIIDGKALTAIFKDEDMAASLLKIGRCCKAVVACRVSPSQKALIVSLVRRGIKPQPMTLAIGDGANDVNMIQTAHVGVGISGQEGVQAVNSSDYAIAQFRFLKPLLLVHGRLNYRRISRVILYSFYKNIALVLTLYFFNFYNGYSGTTLFESFIMAGWNFFLALPIIVIGISDYDVSPAACLYHPALYVSGPWNRDLNVKQFIIWIANALAHALLAFFIPLGIMSTIWDEDGLSDGLNVKGTTVYSVLLLTMNYKVALLAQRWTGWFHFTFWGSIVAYVVWLCIWTTLAEYYAEPFYYASFAMFERWPFWMLLLLVPVASIAIDVTFRTFQVITSPTPAQILREIELGVGDPPKETIWTSSTGEKTHGIPRVSIRRGSPPSGVVHPAASLPRMYGKNSTDVVVDATSVTNPASAAADRLPRPHTGYDFSAPGESHFAENRSTPVIELQQREYKAT